MSLPFLRHRWRNIAPNDFEHLNTFRKRLFVRVVLLFVIPTFFVFLSVRLNIIYLQNISTEVNKRSEKIDRNVEEFLRDRPDQE